MQGHTLASRPQAATEQLPPEHAGAQLVDLFGGQGFPQVDEDARVSLTPGPRELFRLQLRGASAHG